MRRPERARRIDELFDGPLPFELDIDGYNAVRYTFEHSGVPYRAALTRTSSLRERWSLSFGPHGHGVAPPVDGRTAVRVLSTVVACVADFVERRQPESVSWTADGPALERVYAAMESYIATAAARMGLTLRSKQRNDGTMWVLEREPLAEATRKGSSPSRLEITEAGAKSLAKLAAAELAALVDGDAALVDGVWIVRTDESPFRIDDVAFNDSRGVRVSYPIGIRGYSAIMYTERPGTVARRAQSLPAIASVVRSQLERIDLASYGMLRAHNMDGNVMMWSRDGGSGVTFTFNDGDVEPGWAAKHLDTERRFALDDLEGALAHASGRLAETARKGSFQRLVATPARLVADELGALTGHPVGADPMASGMFRVGPYHIHVHVGSSMDHVAVTYPYAGLLTDGVSRNLTLTVAMSGDYARRAARRALALPHAAERIDRMLSTTAGAVWLSGVAGSLVLRLPDGAILLFRYDDENDPSWLEFAGGSMRPTSDSGFPLDELPQLIAAHQMADLGEASGTRSIIADLAEAVAYNSVSGITEADAKSPAKQVAEELAELVDGEAGSVNQAWVVHVDGGPPYRIDDVAFNDSRGVRVSYPIGIRGYSAIMYTERVEAAARRAQSLPMIAASLRSLLERIDPGRHGMKRAYTADSTPMFHGIRSASSVRFTYHDDDMEPGWQSTHGDSGTHRWFSLDDLEGALAHASDRLAEASSIGRATDAARRVARDLVAVFGGRAVAGSGPGPRPEFIVTGGTHGFLVRGDIRGSVFVHHSVYDLRGYSVTFDTALGNASMAARRAQSLPLIGESIVEQLRAIGGPEGLRAMRMRMAGDMDGTVMFNDTVSHYDGMVFFRYNDVFPEPGWRVTCSDGRERDFALDELGEALRFASPDSRLDESLPRTGWLSELLRERGIDTSVLEARSMSLKAIVDELVAEHGARRNGKVWRDDVDGSLVVSVMIDGKPTVLRLLDGRVDVGELGTGLRASVPAGGDARTVARTIVAVMATIDRTRREIHAEAMRLQTLGIDAGLSGLSIMIDSEDYDPLRSVVLRATVVDPSRVEWRIMSDPRVFFDLETASAAAVEIVRGPGRLTEARGVVPLRRLVRELVAVHGVRQQGDIMRHSDQGEIDHEARFSVRSQRMGTALDVDVSIGDGNVIGHMNVGVGESSVRAVFDITGDARTVAARFMALCELAVTVVSEMLRGVSRLREAGHGSARLGHDCLVVANPDRPGTNIIIRPRVIDPSRVKWWVQPALGDGDDVAEFHDITDAIDHVLEWLSEHGSWSGIGPRPLAEIRAKTDPHVVMALLASEHGARSGAVTMVDGGRSATAEFNDVRGRGVTARIRFSGKSVGVTFAIRDDASIGVGRMVDALVDMRGDARTVAARISGCCERAVGCMHEIEAMAATRADDGLRVAEYGAALLVERPGRYYTVRPVVRSPSEVEWRISGDVRLFHDLEAAVAAVLEIIDGQEQ